MFRKFVISLLLSLTCLTSAACGTFEMGRQPERGISRAAATENAAPITKETSTTTVAASEKVLEEGEIITPTIGRETEPTGTIVVERNNLIYHDDTFGFELTLPPTWSGFEMTRNSHEDGSNICFTFTGSAPFCVLRIDVWSKAAWNKLDNVPDGYYLGENEAFIFASGPYQAECVQLDEFQCERHREVPAILAGFRVEE